MQLVFNYPTYRPINPIELETKLGLQRGDVGDVEFDNQAKVLAITVPDDLPQDKVAAIRSLIAQENLVTRVAKLEVHAPDVAIDWKAQWAAATTSTQKLAILEKMLKLK